MTLLTLSPRQRQAIDLRCRDGLTAREIGGRMFLSEHAVRNLLVEAYRAFGIGPGPRKAQVACFRFGQSQQERGGVPAIDAARTEGV